MQTGFEGLDHRPGRPESGGRQPGTGGRRDRENRLRKAGSRFETEYHFTLIDCPPALDLLTVNALVAADSVLIPIQCEFFALEGVSQLLDTIDRIRESFAHSAARSKASS